jgi:hypothetical protein
MKLINKLICWFFGCIWDQQDTAPLEYLECKRCGGFVQYSDMIGDTRHNRLKEYLLHFFRIFVPGKCIDCGKRYGDHSNCIPF